MLKGKSLDEMVRELDARAAAKRDFVVDSRELNVELVGEDQLHIIPCGQRFYFQTSKNTPNSGF